MHQEKGYIGPDIEVNKELFTKDVTEPGDLKLCKVENIAHLHNLLRGDEIRFYNTEVIPTSTN